MSLAEKAVIVLLALFGLGAVLCALAWWLDVRKAPSTVEREAVADAPPVSDLDGSHDDLDVDQFRWAEEVMWLTEMYAADEVPIVPGREHRLPGEAS